MLLDPGARSVEKLRQRWAIDRVAECVLSPNSPPTRVPTCSRQRRITTLSARDLATTFWMRSTGPFFAVARQREWERFERRELVYDRRDDRRAPLRCVERGQVVLGQPERSAGSHVPQEDDDPLAGDPAKLAKAGPQISPVLDGVHGQSGVEAAVKERELLRAGLDHGRRSTRSLRDHRARRLHREHLSIRRLIGAGTRTDVDHRTRVVERVLDQRRDPRIWFARRTVAFADAVVERAHVQAIFVP